MQPTKSTCLRISQLLAELRQVHAMLCRFVLPNENYRNIPAVAVLQNGILIHVHFAKHRGKLAQNRRDRRLRFVAKMATRARIQRDVVRPAPRQSQIFRGIAHGWGFEYFMKGPE